MVMPTTPRIDDEESDESEINFAFSNDNNTFLNNLLNSSRVFSDDELSVLLDDNRGSHNSLTDLVDLDVYYDDLNQSSLTINS